MNEKVMKAAKKASSELSRAGIPHALCGGLAVAYYGFSRMTEDVDFAVGKEAFIERGGGIVTLKLPLIAIDKIPIDLVEWEFQAVESFEGVPVVSLPDLILMKLRAGRQRDISDLVELLKRGKIDPDTVVIPEDLQALWMRVKKLSEKERP